MLHTVTEDGQKVFADTPEELDTFLHLRWLRKQQLPGSVTKAKDDTAHTPRNTPSRAFTFASDLDLTLTMLRAVRDAQGERVTPMNALKGLGVTGPVLVKPALDRISACLSNHGFEFDDVLIQRNLKLGRGYLPGPKLNACLAIIEPQVEMDLSALD